MIKNSYIIAGLAACVILSISPGIGRCAEPGGSVSAVDTLSATDGRTASPAEVDSSSIDDTETGKGQWVGFPAFFYTPETEFGGGLALGHIFPRQGDRHHSSIMGMFLYTEKKQTVAALNPELYLGGGFHGVAQIGYQKFPDSYWGVGPCTGDEDEEKYTPEVIGTRLVGEFEVYPGLRIGGHPRDI